VPHPTFPVVEEYNTNPHPSPLPRRGENAILVCVEKFLPNEGVYRRMTIIFFIICSTQSAPLFHSSLTRGDKPNFLSPQPSPSERG